MASVYNLTTDQSLATKPHSMQEKILIIQNAFHVCLAANSREAVLAANKRLLPRLETRGMSSREPATSLEYLRLNPAKAASFPNSTHETFYCGTQRTNYKSQSEQRNTDHLASPRSRRRATRLEFLLVRSAHGIRKLMQIQMVHRSYASFYQGDQSGSSLRITSPSSLRLFVETKRQDQTSRLPFWGEI